jgi:hypothetical protein
VDGGRVLHRDEVLGLQAADAEGCPASAATAGA